ncbi:EamA family transporter [Sphingobacterium oryzagri]|uniref:EamA family transporter n=1 Tax=Sphingobacterium oryzagri TaxID=3025669 RepID=A0ABY7WEA7_9SPHI|nr:EamA family transporter [Sphingobacterium sp. KACC 22765]WDF66851.1 EamA family transporter [Sphingobacterium sp. KACC 22765]
MWILYALLAAVSAALVVVLTKAGLKNIDSSAAFAVQAIIILIITWTVVLLQPTDVSWKSLETKTWALLIGAGIATTMSTLFSYKALSLGPASYVVTIERTSLVIAVALAIIFLKEKLTWQIVVGSIAIIGGAVLIALSDSSKQ